MKLLFDQHLSPKLTHRLADVCPSSEHIADVGLDRASDRELWAHAKRENLTVLSKDSDFNDAALDGEAAPSYLYEMLNRLMHIGNVPDLSYFGRKGGSTLWTFKEAGERSRDEDANQSELPRAQRRLPRHLVRFRRRATGRAKDQGDAEHLEALADDHE